MTRFFGALMMAVGGLIALLSGLCSLAVLVGVRPTHWIQALEMVGAFGGTPFAIGVALFLVGRQVYRRGGDAPF